MLGEEEGNFFVFPEGEKGLSGILHDQVHEVVVGVNMVEVYDVGVV